MKILNDLLGQELLQLHNRFTDTGTFTKSFLLGAFPQAFTISK